MGKFLYSQNSLDKILRSVVKIQVHTTEDLNVDENGVFERHFSWGTGFYISRDGLILTAAHVINKASTLSSDPISCYDYNIQRSFGTIILYVDDDYDIAILQNPYFGLRDEFNDYFINIDFSEILLRDRTPYFCVGFPQELSDYSKIVGISPGKVISVRKNIPGYKKINWRRNLLVCDCEVTVGFSGGLMIDNDYRPIGLIIGMEEEGKENNSFIRTFIDIKHLLTEYLE